MLSPECPEYPEYEESGREAAAPPQIPETVTAPGGGYAPIRCLTIVGQIEGHFALPQDAKSTKYEHVIPALVSAEQDDSVSGLLILLNTAGGDVEAGLAIAELIAGMKKPTVSLVLGGGHSIGIPLAVSAKRSFIARSASMTLHPVRMNGMIMGVPATLSYFNKMQERINRFITCNSQIEEIRLRELMMKTGELIFDVGTILDGESAVREGIIDRVGGLSDAMEELKNIVDNTAK